MTQVCGKQPWWQNTATDEALPVILWACLKDQMQKHRSHLSLLSTFWIPFKTKRKRLHWTWLKELLYSNTFEGGGLIEMGGLINLAKTTVSVPHKGLKYRLSGKSSRTRNWRSCSWGSKTNPVFQLVNKPSQISTLEFLQIWLINTVNHSLVNNNNGERKGGEGRGGGLKREGEGLLTFFSWKGGTY